MLKMVDGTGIIGVDMVCPLGATVSPPQPPNYDNVEMEGIGSLMLPNSLKAPLERLELSGNSVQGENPAPEAPQEIKSAGRKSKNLFDINYFKNKNNLQTIRCEGFSLLGITCNVKPNTEYTLSANVAEKKYNLNIANKTNRISLASSPTRTLMSNDDGTLYIGIFGVTADKVNMDDFMKQYKNIQLEEGNVATAYEPYGHLIDLKVTGKNMLNLQKEPDVKGLYQGWKVGDGEKTIVLSIKDKNNNADIRDYSLGATRNGVNSNDGLEWVVQNGVIKRSEIKTINPYVSIYPPNETSVQKFLERFDIQVEYGETATSYEPYTEQTVQIALNEPLRGADKYKDVLTKDGVVRKIKSRTFDGSENWRKRTNNTVNTNHFVLDLEDINKKLSTGGYFCDKLSMININADEMGHRFYSGSLYVMMPKEQCPDLEAFKTWLSQNLITAEYIIAEPVTEPLSESVQQQLQALHSENGTTHIFVDSGEVEAGIKLTYRKEK